MGNPFFSYKDRLLAGQGRKVVSFFRRNDSLYGRGPLLWDEPVLLVVVRVR
jgi:hypothetical protein